MVGEMHEQLVAARIELGEKRALAPRLVHEARTLPGPVDEMQAAHAGMAFEHLAGVGIDECVDLDMGRAVLQYLEHRRREKHVTVVPELHHQRALNRRKIDGVRDHRG
jgi:hypothetical protein